MSEPLCVAGCGRPSPDAYLDRGCARRLEKILAEIPSQLHDLEVTIARQGNAGGRGGGHATKKAEHPLPFDAHASDLAHAVRNALANTVRHLCESRGLSIPALLPGSAAMATWLCANIEAIRQDEAAGDIFAGMVQIAGKLSGAVDNQERRFAGTCTSTVLAGALSSTDERITVEAIQRRCDEALYMRNNATKITCRACGAEYDPVSRMKQILDNSVEHLALISFIDAALVDAGYIRPRVAHVWLERDRKRALAEQEFFAWASDSEGRPLYRLGDFIDRAKRGHALRSA